jgi:hypothetical protein
MNNMGTFPTSRCPHLVYIYPTDTNYLVDGCYLLCGCTLVREDWTIDADIFGL